LKPGNSIKSFVVFNAPNRTLEELKQSIRCYQARKIFSPNRTLEELKLYGDLLCKHLLHSQSHLRGIETRQRDATHEDHAAPNRTLEELKLLPSEMTAGSNVAPNRTLEELKRYPGLNIKPAAGLPIAP